MLHHVSRYFPHERMTIGPFFEAKKNLLLSPALAQLALSWAKALQKSRSVHEPQRHLVWRVTGDFSGTKEETLP